MSDRTCPDYRLRLFQSVDLVGSTAFKARYSEPEAGSPNPYWVTQIRHFYREFPRILSVQFDKLKTLHPELYANCGPPRTWKTIGDEIIFCVRLRHLEHLAISTQAFINAMGEYGKILEEEGKSLDVKGISWIASFPTPNVIVDLNLTVNGGEAGASFSDQMDEAEEARADKHPHEYDFLGKQIDAGFRSGKLSSEDSMAASLELALLLARASLARLIDAKFFYNGRHVLKGVIGSRPYPLVTVDVERSESRRTIRGHERDITGQRHADERHLVSFLETFIRNKDLELPVLSRCTEQAAEKILPESYMKFRTTWEQVKEENEKRAAGEAAAESPDNDGEGPLPQSVTNALNIHLPE